MLNQGGRVGRAIVIAIALSACLGPTTTFCPNGAVCPSGLQCLALASGEDVCVLPTCGDGVLDVGEMCDDGNRVEGDGCRPDCQVSCGDGRVDSHEACDDGNVVDGDGCSSDCRSKEACGNGITDLAANETCDDSNSSSRDGCSSACKLESPTWTSLDQSPTDRVRHAFAYDARRGKTVVFGGCSDRAMNCSQGPLDDTWEWDGESWSLITPPSSPPPRADHVMTYDAERGRVVMFGGCGEIYGFGCMAPLSDTWEWDGRLWQRRTPATSPTARQDAAMTYDAARRRVLLFGGALGAKRDDTWTWDGTTWTQLAPMVSPPPRRLHAMAYDAIRQRVVLFGGLGGMDSPLDDTWEWNGAQWTNRQPSIKPPARRSHAMVFATSSGSVIMTGGCVDFVLPPMTNEYSCTQRLGDVWEWDGMQWSARPATPFPPRFWHGLVYDTARERAVMFGGEEGGATFATDTWELTSSGWLRRIAGVRPPSRVWGQIAYDAARAHVVMFGGLTLEGFQYYDDTWIWNGAWTQRSTATKPPARRWGAMAYDSSRRRMVLFGGDSENVLVNDTWVWDGSDWARIATPTAPSRRYGHAMAYDAKRKRVILFGGTLAVGASAETWELDGNVWTRSSPAVSPPIRTNHVLGYDVVRERIVMFGGTSAAGTQLGDTWEWDGIAWIERTPAQSPQPRSGAAMAYHPGRRSLVVFGGLTNDVGGVSADDLWEWDGTTWRPIITSMRPPRRNGATLVFDAAHAGMILLGGSSPALGAREDVWRFSFESESPLESCRTGFDGDEDGQVGCDDPDCAGICDPICANLNVCEADRPRCGDGVCASIESCRTCMGDCGVCASVCGDLLCDPGESCASCAGDCGCP